MKTFTRMVVNITKKNLPSLFASALLAAASAATPMTVYAQSNPIATGQDLNLNAPNPAAPTTRRESELAKLDTLPAAGRAYISRTLGADMPAYHVAGSGTDLHAASRGLKSDFTAQGVELSADNSHLRLSLDAYGHGNNLTKATAASATRVNTNRVEYRRVGITEWYENGPLGLEQGFTVQHLEKNNSGLLTVALGMEGNMTAKVKEGGKSVTLSSTGGKNQFDYAGLVATDADGKELPSHLEVAGGRLLIKVDDGAAHYPVTIDPYVYQSTLPATFSNPGTDGAISVAVDGKPSDFVVAVGALYVVQPNTTSSGVVYVFESTNCCTTSSTWTTSTLYPSDGANGDWFGLSVSIENNAYLSSEGQTIVVGAPKHAVNSNAAAGKAYVYVKPTGGWVNSIETGGLVNGSGLAGVEFGFSVSVQDNNVAIGEPQPYNCATNCLAGAAYVYVQPTLGWSTCTPCITPSATLTVPALANGSEFGFSVSISNTPGQKGIVIVGAPQPPGWGGCACGPGHAYVYQEPTGGWSGLVPIHKTLPNPHAPSKDWFGMSVSSTMGYLAVVGAPNATCPTAAQPNGCGTGYPTQTGLAYEYESNNNWITPGALFPSNGATGDLFGGSVSTDGKGGDLVAVGSVDHHSHQGAGYLFTTRHFGTGKYHHEDQGVSNTNSGQFGWSVSAYVDMGGVHKSAAVFGAPVTNSYSGAAYLYWHP